MPYQIAGIDVHKKMLAVVVADVEVEGDYHFERLKVGTSPAQLRALADWLVEREVEEVVMESTAQYWRPVWEALERHWRPVRRTRAGASPMSGTPSPCAGPIQSWRRRAQTGLSGCRTIGEASGGPRAHLELCARRRAAPLADGDAPQVPDHAQPRAAAQSIGIAARRSAHQAVQPRLGSAGHQRTTYAAGPGRRRNGSRDAGGAGGPAFTRDGGSIVGRPSGMRDSPSRVSPAAEADPGRIAFDRGSPRPA